MRSKSLKRCLLVWNATVPQRKLATLALPRRRDDVQRALPVMSM